MKALRKFAENYNIFWVLFFILIVFSQGSIVYQSLSKFPLFTAYNYWDIVLAAVYLLGLFVFIFKKKLFNPTTWKFLLALALIDLPLGAWRTMYGDNPANLQFNCQTMPEFCNIFLPFLFLSMAASAAPIYYAFAKLAFPRFSLPFSLYPTFTIEHISNPNRFWAIPLLGIFIKSILLIPFLIFEIIIIFVTFLLQIINYFHIVIMGRVWKPAFTFTMWTISLNVSSSAYVFGMTNKYPSFGKKMNDPLISITHEPPVKSNRLLGLPLIGPIVRYILIIPIMSLCGIIYYAGFLGSMLGCFAVLFTGKYPQTVKELLTDALRIQSSTMLYITAMTDKYPSYLVSLNNPYKKALLILFIFLLSGVGSFLGTSLNSMSQQGGSLEEASKTIFRENFMNECSTDEAIVQYCECTYDYLVTNYSMQELTEMGSEFEQTSQPPQAMMDASQACYNFIPEELLQEENSSTPEEI